MSDETWDPNGSLVCPFDPLHIISVKRYQYHIIKCRKNHPNKDFVPCPFNAKHVVLRPELKTHIAHCPNRVVLEHDIMKEQCPETGESYRLKGKTDIPRGNYHVPETDENWDDEIEESITQRFEEHTIQSQRNYEDSGFCLRRPNMPESGEASQRFSVQLPGRIENRTPVFPEDSSSVHSYATRSSSIYVDPVKWNNAEFRKTSSDKDKKLQNNVLGRGALLTKFKTKTTVGRDKSVLKPDRPNGVNVTPIRKPFGRGTLMETVKNYNGKR